MSNNHYASSPDDYVDNHDKFMAAYTFSCELGLGFGYAAMYQRDLAHYRGKLLELAKEIMTTNQRQRLDEQMRGLQRPGVSEKDVTTHFRCHLSSDGRIVNYDGACDFCKNRQNSIQKGHDYEQQGILGMVKELLEEEKAREPAETKVVTPNSPLEKVVKLLDGRVSVILPRKWLGKTVRVSLAA